MKYRSMKLWQTPRFAADTLCRYVVLFLCIVPLFDTWQLTGKIGRQAFNMQHRSLTGMEHPRVIFTSFSVQLKIKLLNEVLQRSWRKWGWKFRSKCCAWLKCTVCCSGTAVMLTVFRYAQHNNNYQGDPR